MSLAIAHFVLGVGLTSVLVALVAPRFRFQRTVLFLGGLWAMVPDASHVFGSVGALRAIQRSEWGTIFFFHRRLDLMDPADSIEFAAVIVGVAFGLMLVAEAVGYLQPIVLGAIRDAVGSSERGEYGRR